jgi:cell division protein FtsB
MDQDLITKVAVGIASIGAGIYAVIRMLKSDRREDNKADLTDSATQQVIQMLREEVARLSDRLAAVEEQNRKCEEANDALREELIAMKKPLHLF